MIYEHVGRIVCFVGPILVIVSLLIWVCDVNQRLSALERKNK